MYAKLASLGQSIAGTQLACWTAEIDAYSRLANYPGNGRDVHSNAVTAWHIDGRGKALKLAHCSG